jgi:hypothetical protein
MGARFWQLRVGMHANRQAGFVDMFGRGWGGFLKNLQERLM